MQADENTRQESDSHSLTLTTGLHRRYIFVLAVIAFLSIVAYGLLEIVISSQRSSSAEINIAGRQRMLSQRISLFSTKLAITATAQERAEVLDELDQAVSLMETSHLGLTEGNEALGLSKPSSQALISIYYGPVLYVDREVWEFLRSVKQLHRLASIEQGNAVELMKKINSQAQLLLPNLDVAVSLYQAESEARIDRLLWFQSTNLFVLLVTVFAAGLLIFRPMVSRLKLAVADLAEAEERFRSITNSSEMAMVIAVDHKGTVISWNPAAEKTFGWREQEILGQPLTVIMPERYRKPHTEGFRRACDTDTYKIIGQTIELVALHKDGHEFPIELSIGTWKKAGKKYFSAIIHDITRRKNTEMHLRRSQKMEAVGQLTGGIAHDFNNILGIIHGNLELLQRALVGNDRALARVDKALKGTVRGAAITRKLLNFSRKDAQEVSPVAVNDFITNLRDLIAKSITASITVDLNLDQDLWTVAIDPGDLEDALLNLALNARDAMPEGGELVLETANKTLDESYVTRNPGSKSGDFVMVSVSDTGEGMSDEVKEKVLEPFFTTKEQGKGTGLGLSMVYGFVQRSGGHMKIYSELGEGTTIRIFLPRAEKDVSENRILRNSSELPRGEETILIVDDEEALLDVAITYLEELGYNTIPAKDAEHAYKIVKEQDGIDLLFTDIIMPGDMDGYGLAKSVLTEKPDIKVLLASGFTKSREQHLNGDHGYLAHLASNLLSKPYNQEELAVAVRDALDHKF